MKKRKHQAHQTSHLSLKMIEEPRMRHGMPAEPHSKSPAPAMVTAPSPNSYPSITITLEKLLMSVLL